MDKHFVYVFFCASDNSAEKMPDQVTFFVCLDKTIKKPLKSFQKPFLLEHSVITQF